MTIIDKINDFFLRLARYRAIKYQKNTSYDHYLKDKKDKKKLSGQ